PAQNITPTSPPSTVTHQTKHQQTHQTPTSLQQTLSPLLNTCNFILIPPHSTRYVYSYMYTVSGCTPPIICPLYRSPTPRTHLALLSPVCTPCT
ncbi:MAG: hypothetical protein AAGJ35_11220, partial [Myxococcota bacterium]